VCEIALGQLAACRLSLNDLQAAFPAAAYAIVYRESLAEQFAAQQPLVADEKIIVNPAELRAYCDQIRRLYCELIRQPVLAGRSIVVSYEALLARPAHALLQLSAMLEIQLSVGPARARVENSPTLSSRIENYHDISALVNGPLCRQSHRLPAPIANSSRAA
jgi:hypothetical protein